MAEISCSAFTGEPSSMIKSSMDQSGGIICAYTDWTARFKIPVSRW